MGGDVAALHLTRGQGGVEIGIGGEIHDLDALKSVRLEQAFLAAMCHWP